MDFIRLRGNGFCSSQRQWISFVSEAMYIVRLGDKGLCLTQRRWILFVSEAMRCFLLRVNTFGLTSRLDIVFTSVAIHSVQLLRKAFTSIHFCNTETRHSLHSEAIHFVLLLGIFFNFYVNLSHQLSVNAFCLAFLFFNPESRQSILFRLAVKHFV